MITSLKLNKGEAGVWSEVEAETRFGAQLELHVVGTLETAYDVF